MDPGLTRTLLGLTFVTGSDLSRRGAAFAAILAGAATGAMLLKTSLVLPVAAAAATTLVAGLAPR